MADSRTQIQGRTYDEWMRELDVLVEAKYGITVADGVDFPSDDVWRSGASAKVGLEEWEDWNDIDIDPDSEEDC